MADKLHYNKNELLQEYTNTFKMFMVTLMVGVGGAVQVGAQGAHDLGHAGRCLRRGGPRPGGRRHQRGRQKQSPGRQGLEQFFGFHGFRAFNARKAPG